MHPTPRNPDSPVRAFTIAEVIVAVVITAFVAAATSVALTQAARARDASTAKVEARSRAELAASRIAADVENAVRHDEVFFTRVKLADGRQAGFPRDEILLYARSLKLVRTRSEQGEGGEYEVQYRLDSVPRFTPPPATRAARPGDAPAAAALALWRRADPVPDDVPDGGGVASAIVDGILGLDIQAYDGSAWFETWESDTEGYPHAISIQVTATDDSGRYEAVCRRVVPLDRTPLPSAPVVIEEAPTTGSTN
ncbi:MAG: type II secretion system protein J [Phycisphaerales bacterium]